MHLPAEKELYYPDTRVCCISHSLQQPVVLWIESDREGTVYYTTWKTKYLGYSEKLRWSRQFAEEKSSRNYVVEVN